MYIGLPSFYGAWLHIITGLTQHAGLAEDVLDHRLNCRTVYMNPIIRFLYWNMNYHVEHHMFPMVPYHALPDLHAEMKDDTPTPYPSILAAYREIIPALIHQVRQPGFYVVRQLPPTARSSFRSTRPLPNRGHLLSASRRRFVVPAPPLRRNGGQFRTALCAAANAPLFSALAGPAGSLPCQSFQEHDAPQRPYGEGEVEA